MYHVDISNSGASTFKVKSATYEFTVDTLGAGITPPDTLLASLGSCIGVYIRKYFAGAKLPIREFAISLDAELSKESPVCFKEIKVSIDLLGTPLEERRVGSLLEFLKNCPVHNTLNAGPSVEIKIL